MGIKINNLEPIHDNQSEILILGTFPGVKSRENNFYYENNRNRFWKVISAITGYKECATKEEKIKMLLDNKIAVWDVLSTCDIDGSSDKSIKNVVANDLSIVMKNINIKRIYTNGEKAAKLYNISFR